MATYKDPIQCFAPIEVIERLLEIREGFGYQPAVFLNNSRELADCLDAYGFDIYAFSQKQNIDYGDYRAPLAPSGEISHTSLTAH